MHDLDCVSRLSKLPSHGISCWQVLIFNITLFFISMNAMLDFIAHCLRARILAGALFFNLSPANVEGKFTDKGGAAKLLHMVFTVAREPIMGPSVIYIDEVSTGAVRALR
jgi:hypothetical protein